MVIDQSRPSIVSAVVPEVADSSASLVRKDNRLITETYGPVVLDFGEVMDIVNTKEQGEIVYVKVITDNPYTSVLLELDDYRNKEPNGETVAELLYSGRTSDSTDNQFYAIDKGPDGGYALVYNPQKPEGYAYKVRLQVINSLPRSSDVYGFKLNHVSKKGLPTPVTPGYIGGGEFQHPALTGATLELVSAAMAKPIGASPYQVANVYNEAVFNTDSLDLGSDHPYQGLAGKPYFRRDKSMLTSAKGAVTVDGHTLHAAETTRAAGPTNPKVLFGTQYTLGGGVDTSDFPGTPGSPSSMTVTFTDSTEVDGAVATEYAVGDRVYIRNGDTVYFPGKVSAVATVSGGTANQITIQPGLANIPTKFQTTDDSDNYSFGKVVSQAELNPKILVKKVIVKRRRKISYEG